MISVYNQKEKCCGCTACQHICPVDAIKMESDTEGFLYPAINQVLCIDCGMCIRVCAFQNGYDKSQNFEIPDVYAVKHKDEKIRMSSTSGGAFSAISDKVLDDGGIVYGATFDNNWNVVHKIASNKKERDLFKGSKYVQSDLGNTYKEIKEFLKSNRIVLFTGTPCQTAGLKRFLNMKKISTDNLILCDIVCHGTPSPLIWREHVSYLEKKYNNSIIEYYFRTKVKGWHNNIQMVVFENGKKDFKSLDSQSFKRLFLLHYIIRPSCHECKYTNLSRPSDITIADYWGVENVMPEYDDNKGVSLVLINSNKGKDLFNSISNNISYRCSNIRDCIQPQLQYPTKPAIKRDEFWNDYFLYGYSYVIKKYADVNFKGAVKARLKRLLTTSGLIKFFR